MSFESKAKNLYVDIKEILSRKVVDTTVNQIIFRSKENKSLPHWASFINAVVENNDLERLHKTDCKLKSQFGKNYVGFDIWRGKPIIWIADRAASNQSLRINGFAEWAIVVNRTYSSINGGVPILKQQLVITDNDIAKLFLSGFGVKAQEEDKVKKVNALSKIQFSKLKLKYLNKHRDDIIPIQWVSTTVPSYIGDQFQIGTHSHNYGVLPCMEMLNKDWIDNDDGGVETNYNKQSDIFFSDWWPARDMIDFYNGFVEYFALEILLDHTRVIGMFSQQDLNQLVKNNANRFSSVENRTSDYIYNQILENQNQEYDWVKKRLIVRSVGSEGTQVVVMNSQLKSTEHTDTLEKQLSFIFKLCGYSWDSDSAKVYENVSQTMNSSKGVYETTKQKITLFTRQWINFYSKLAFAWFKNNGFSEIYSSWIEVKQEFSKNVDFQIISNVLQQENNDWKKVIELKTNGLISVETAIRSINPEWEEEEVLEEVRKIEEENKSEMQKFNFNNEDFNGFEENENPAVEGEKQDE